MSNTDKAIVFGGPVIILAFGLAFALFPMYQLLDGSVVHRPFWDPPEQKVREAFQGLTLQDIERLKQDPRQQEYLVSLAKPIVFRPKPSWIGYEKIDPNKSVRGHGSQVPVPRQSANSP